MMSNSKLNQAEKSILKDMQQSNPEIQFAKMGKTTIAFKRQGNLVKFATAICADNEKKHRPKVGKYWAITRFDAGQTVSMPDYQFDNMLENEESLTMWN